LSRLKTLVVALMLGVVASGPSAAAANTLTPPPPPGAKCTGNDQNTTCFFSFTLVQTGVEAGVDCGAFQVLENALVYIDVKREYNRDGNLVRATRHLQQPLSGSDNVWYNPQNQKSVPQIGDWKAQFDFTTPGDTSSAVETDTGGGSRVLLPGGPVLAMEAGRIVFGPPPDFVIQFAAGQHRIESGDVGRVCAALT